MLKNTTRRPLAQRCLAATWTASLFLALSAPLQAGAATTTRCRVDDFPDEVQCGQIQRPLDPAHPEGKKITVHYVVLPSLDRNKLSDAVFLLAGGPGQSAISLAAFGGTILERLNLRRDLVFVDQRGTGRSAPLECPQLQREGEIGVDAESVALALACSRQLQSLPYGDLRFFSTSIAVQDLEAIRLQQGYGKINLVGASYGTRVGLEYLRQYPQSVRRMVLDGVVPPVFNLAGDAQAALDGLFADCAANAACDKAYPQLAVRWRKLLDAPPRRVSFAHPRTGGTVSASIDRDTLLRLVHKTLYVSSNMAALPYSITQAELGNVAPLMALSGAYSLPAPSGIAIGMHFSVWCGEAYGKSAPLLAGAGVDAFRTSQDGLYGAVCAAWPKAQIPAAFYTLAPSAAPVLLLSGGIDPVTPKRHGDAVAKALGPKARHIVIDNLGHGLLAHGCISDVVSRYLNAKDEAQAGKVDTACVRQIPRPLAWKAYGVQP